MKNLEEIIYFLCFVFTLILNILEWFGHSILYYFIPLLLYLTMHFLLHYYIY